MIAAVAIVGAALLGAPAPGFADATNISSAPAIAVGTQEFGNTATGADGVLPGVGCAGNPGGYASYWSLATISGDAFTIDWEGTSQTAGSMALHIYPVGTTDYTLDATEPIASSSLESNGKAQLTFTSTRSGVLPLEVYTPICLGQPGPYDFTVYVKHSVRLSSLPRRRVPSRGSITVRVHTPDGAAISDASLRITLEVSLRGRWRAIGHASAQAGSAHVRFTMPRQLRGTVIRLRAIATGRSYVTSVTRVARVRATR